MIMEAYEAGQRIFGENHVQEVVKKYEQLPADIEWHFIGHLQTNKVRQIVPFVRMIHSVDTPHLHTQIEKEASRVGRVIPCLLQLHLAQEDTKFGFTINEAWDYLTQGTWRQMSHAPLAGIMCMASHVDDEKQIADEFERAHQFFLDAKNTFFAQDPTFRECSWGMSEDYHIAVRHGSTLVRVGSRIFGERDYGQK